MGSSIPEFTADLTARVWQHKNGIGSKFCRKYNCDKLVYHEMFSRIEEAIGKEKQLKKWNREWKNKLIQDANPGWLDLFSDDL